MLIFDGHLDLAMNALSYERDITGPLKAVREREAAGVPGYRGRAMVTLPELRQGGVGGCVATLLARAKPWVRADRDLPRDNDDWPDQTMAYAVARGQLAYYRLLESRGELAILTDREALRNHVAAYASDSHRTPLGVILTMEGADPIIEPTQLRHWHALGLRTLMLAHFGVSHYAAGTPSDDPSNVHDVDRPLTDAGRVLLEEMAALAMPLDLSHLSDQSFAEAVERFPGAIYSSHAACRAIQPIPRNHSDDQLRTILDRDGVIGLPLFNHFLRPEYTKESDSDSVTLDHVVDHVDHVCQLAGDANHVAIGSDFDGGFGADHTPRDLETAADLPRLADALERRGFGGEDIGDILSRNWIAFFTRTLPEV